MGGEEADKERREEELQALEAIYGDAFTLGRLHSCHSLTQTSKSSGNSQTQLSHMSSCALRRCKLFHNVKIRKRFHLRQHCV